MEQLAIKIKKLLEKAESLKQIGSLKEATIFLEKAHQLIEENNLSLHEISQIELNQSIIEDNIDYGQVKSDGLWEKDLMQVICHFCNCKLLYTTPIYFKTIKPFLGSLTIIGEKNNVQIAKFLFSFLSHVAKKESSRTFNEMRQMYLHTSKSPEADGYIPWRKVYVRSFLKGFSKGVISEVRRYVKRFTPEQEQVQQLGLMKLNIATEEYINTKYGNVKQEKNKQHKLNELAEHKGRMAGLAVQINPQIEHDAKKLLE